MDMVRNALKALNSTGPDRVNNYGIGVGKAVDGYIRQIDEGTMDNLTYARLQKVVMDTGFGMQRGDSVFNPNAREIMEENMRRHELKDKLEKRTLDFARRIENLDEVDIRDTSFGLFGMLFAVQMAYFESIRNLFPVMTFPFNLSGPIYSSRRN